MVKLADDSAFPLRLGHVNCRALVAEPVGTVARIYDAFGLELSRASREAMPAKVERAPNGAYGANRQRPEEFGIDPERESASASRARTMRLSRNEWRRPELSHDRSCSRRDWGRKRIASCR
jgi:hypothetical protein